MTKQKHAYCFVRQLAPCTAAVSAIAPSLLVLVGCSQVKPQTDYAQTRQLITESTGVEVVYDPDEPLLTPEELDAMLADGLTLDEALRIALSNNRQLHAEFMDIGVAKADWVQSGLFSNPSLGLSLQFPEGGGRSNFQASLAQNIVDLWQIPVKKRTSQHALEQTILRIARLAGELTADTKAAYYRAVAAQMLWDVAKENRSLTQKSYEAAKAQREAGATSALDENLMLGQTLTAELDVRNARLALSNARRRLARILSLDRNVEMLTLSDGLLQKLFEPKPADALVDLARKSRLDLRALAAEVRSSKAKARLEWLKIFPEISIGPFLERGERRAQPGRKIMADFARASIANGALTAPDIQTRGQRRAERRQDIDAIIGPALTMTLPVFDQNQAQIAKAQYLYEQDIKSYEALYLSVAQEIRTAADQAETAATNVVFYRDELVPQAERNLGFAADSYTTGQTSILALLQAQRLHLEARQGHIEVRLEAATTVSGLERAVGMPADKMNGVTLLGSRPAAGTTVNPADGS